MNILPFLGSVDNIVAFPVCNKIKTLMPTDIDKQQRKARLKKKQEFKLKLLGKELDIVLQHKFP